MDQLTQNLRAVVGAAAVLTEPDELLVYECDALPQHKQRPRAVVFPQSTAEVAEVLRVLARERVPFAPRGAGTGLSGGALTTSVVIELARMRRLLKLDAENRTAVVETGMINAQLSRAVSSLGLHYVPDPSSQMTCTIGGNIAENAGGIHCLKYGMTVDHVAGARVVLAGGEIVDLRAGGAAAPGYDVLGVFIGSEGTFGIATEATLLLTPLPPAVRTLLADFTSVDDGSRAVSAIIAAGLIPAALEMMDGVTIRAVEQSVFAAGLPFDAEAALLIELDGLAAGLDDEAQQVESICRAYGARTVRLARNEQERKKFWAARKGAFGAMGRLAPDLMLQDAVVPRSRLPAVLAEIYSIGAQNGLLVANVFHAGDGNLHPYICFDSRNAEEVQRVKEAGREMMECCVRAGGTITGEHGVGLDKSDYLPLIFSDEDMSAMLRVRAAFDPAGWCNPGKIIPTSRSCGEARAARPQRGVASGQARGESAESSSTSGRDSEAESAALEQVNPLAAFPRFSVAASQSLPAQPSSLPVRPPFNDEAAREALARCLGAEHVTSSPRDKSDASCLSVSPANADESCEILRQAAREQWAVVPAGAGTWLTVGRLMPRVDVILQTRRLRRIIEHEPADLVATAEAGITLAEFNEHLKRAGQWLPLDAPESSQASLGGIVATGIGGAQSLGYGPPRGCVIGMRVALADGRVIKAGGRVVKNVAGYDLCKLFTGSYGTLGLILELTFKLRPLPARQATVIASGPLQSLWHGARALLDAPLFPVALELLDQRAAAAINAPVARAESYVLLARFAGAAKTVAFQLEQARALLDVTQQRTAVSSDDEPLWHALSALRLPDQLSWRAQVPPTALNSLLTAEQTDRASLFPDGGYWHAGVGDGRLRVIAPARPTGEAIQWLETWRAWVRQQAGSFIVESAPPEVKAGFEVWGDVGAAASLMQRIKQQLDPANTFSPGRFVAGI